MNNHKFFHSVYLNEELCNGCINCIKRCPTQAIRVRNGKAVITSQFCIDCGECIRICAHHAKRSNYDRPDILSNFKYTVALPAPSLYSQFNNLDDINNVYSFPCLCGNIPYLKFDIPPRRTCKCRQSFDSASDGNNTTHGSRLSNISPVSSCSPVNPTLSI